MGPASTRDASRPRSCSRPRRCPHDPACPRLRRRRRRADARPVAVASTQAGGDRPPHQGSRLAPQESQGHRVRPARGGRRRGPAHRVRLADGTEVQGKHLVIATGRILLASCSLFRRHTCVVVRPRARARGASRGAAIIGGGVIGAEFASMLADMGSEVTIIERCRGSSRPTDIDAGTVVARSFKKRGIRGAHVGARHGDRRIRRADGHVGDRRGRAVGRRRQDHRQHRDAGGGGSWWRRARGVRRRDRRPRLRGRRRAVAHERPRRVCGR